MIYVLLCDLVFLSYDPKDGKQILDLSFPIGLIPCFTCRLILDIGKRIAGKKSFLPVRNLINDGSPMPPKGGAVVQW